MVSSIRTLVVLAVLLACGAARAGELTVPVATQVEMLAKLVHFDRGFRGRAGDAAHIYVLEAPGRAESHRVAQALKSALEAMANLDGLGVAVEILTYGRASDLSAKCSAGKVAAFYLAPEFTTAEVQDIAHALTSVSVLTASSSGSDVPAGVVVGFDLFEGKPKILVNLPQAEKQGVSFTSSFLSLARVIR